MKFDQYETEDRRLVLLRALQHATQYKANAYLLRRYCESIGHTVIADRIEQDIAWLAERGLVERAQHLGVTVATLTQRGLDVATGAASVPGVQRPQPGV